MIKTIVNMNRIISYTFFSSCLLHSIPNQKKISFNNYSYYPFTLSRFSFFTGLLMDQRKEWDGSCKCLSSNDKVHFSLDILKSIRLNHQESRIFVSLCIAFVGFCLNIVLSVPCRPWAGVCGLS